MARGRGIVISVLCDPGLACASEFQPKRFIAVLLHVRLLGLLLRPPVRCHSNKNNVEIACLRSAEGSALSVCEVSIAVSPVATADAYYVRARITYSTVPIGSASRLAAIAGAR